MEKEEGLGMKEMFEGLKHTKIAFPCGLEIDTTKEIVDDIKSISCPLHGSKCENVSIRKIENLTKK